jgi:GNAT superfamily N-acetyltransferase
MNEIASRLLTEIKKSHFWISSILPEDYWVLYRMMVEFAAYLGRSGSVFVNPQDLEKLLSQKVFTGAFLWHSDSPHPAGYALYFPKTHSFSGRTILWVEDVYVRPQFRQRGAGRFFMISLAEEALIRGWGGLEFEVARSNASAISFYKKLGALEQESMALCSWDEDDITDFVESLPK